MNKKSAALSSIIAAVFLTLFKFVVGLLTFSLGILSEALHSLLDLLAALITYISVNISDKPADKSHHYGHGKIDNLSALIESVLLIVTSGWIIYEAVGRLTSGNVHIQISIWSYVVVITSIIIDISRSRMLFKVAKQSNSQALEADAIHFSTDILSSGVVLLGLIVSNFGYYNADAYSAIGVAIIVLFISYRLGKRAINVLLDHAPDGVMDIVEKKLKSIPEIKGYHDLKIRTAGPDTFIRVNIHLNDKIDLTTAHLLCDKIEHDIGKMIPRCEVTIHAEPENENKS
jgi:cation diffusion facilitator family transporter